MTKLILAVMKNEVEKVKKLINSGCDVNERDDDNNVALHYVRSLEIAELLLQENAKVNVMNNSEELVLAKLLERIRDTEVDEKELTKILELLVEKANKELTEKFLDADFKKFF